MKKKIKLYLRKRMKKMIDVEKIKKEFEELMQKIQLQYGGLTKKEKAELLFLGERFNHFITCQTAKKWFLQSLLLPKVQM